MKEEARTLFVYKMSVGYVTIILPSQSRMGKGVFFRFDLTRFRALLRLQAINDLESMIFALCMVEVS